MAEQEAQNAHTDLDPTVEAILRQAWMVAVRKSARVQRILYDAAMSRMPKGAPLLVYDDVGTYLLRLRTPLIAESGKAKAMMGRVRKRRVQMVDQPDPEVRDRLVRAIRSSEMGGVSTDELQALFPGIAQGQLETWCTTLVREGHVGQRVQHQPKSKRVKPRYVSLVACHRSGNNGGH